MLHLRRIIPVIAALLFFSTAQAQIDPLPNIKFGVNIGAYAAGEEFTRSVEDYTLRPALSLYFEYPMSSRYGMSADLVGGIISKDVHQIQIADPGYPFNNLSYKTTVIGSIIGPYYRLPIIPNLFSINAHANFGIFSRITTGRKDEAYFADPIKAVITWGVGISTRYAITENMAARVVYNGFLTNSDDLDGFASGNDHDGFSHFAIGLVWNIYNDRLDDMPFEPFAADPDDVIRSAGETVLLRPEGRSEWTSNIESDAVPQNEAALTYSSIELSQFASIRDLEKDESRLILTLDKQGRANLPIEVSFELLKDGNVVAQGIKSLNVMQQRSALTAGQFIDFRGLNIAPGYAGSLPDGDYTMRIAVEDLRNDEVSENEIHFYKVNIEQLFGDNTASMQSLIDQNKAQIVPSANDEVLIRVLPKNGHPLLAHRSKRYSNASGGLGNTLADAELEESVSETFHLALGIQDKLSQLPNQPKKPVILLAEIYFDETGETFMDEADKRLIDNIARRMRNHPQIRMELRGTADEYIDMARAKELAQVRAVRVMDALSRLLVPGYRMEVSGAPVPNSVQRDGMLASKLENRKVSLVMTSY